MFFVDDAIVSALSALTTNGGGEHATALSSSTDCSYYSCDHSADYIGNGSDGVTNLTKDGVIYPEYKPFGAVAEPTHAPSMLSSADCSYYSCDHSQDYIGSTSDGVNNLTKDGVIYPEYKPFGAVAEPNHAPSMLSSADCSYYSCDHSHDYVGTTSDGVTDLTKDGTIYPSYQPFAVAQPTHGPTMLTDAGNSGYAVDNSADYIGSDGKLLTDGVIYPAQAKAAPLLPILDSTDCSYYSCDHSADYIGTHSDGVSNLTSPGTIYPDFKYGVWGANAEHSSGVQPTMLADGSHSLPSDNSGAYYCDVPEAKCTTTVADPPTPAITLAAHATSSLYQATDHSGAYYCGEPEATCSTTVVDPVLKPIVYPAVSTELAAPMVAGDVAKGPVTKPSRPSPGHLVLMGHACIFGAIDATAKLASGLFSTEEGKKEESSWSQDFMASSTAAAGAVTPIGAFILRERVLKASA